MINFEKLLYAIVGAYMICQMVSAIDNHNMNDMFIALFGSIMSLILFFSEDPEKPA